MVNGLDIQVPVKQPVDVTATIGLNSPSDLYDLVGDDHFYSMKKNVISNWQQDSEKLLTKLVKYFKIK